MLRHKLVESDRVIRSLSSRLTEARAMLMPNELIEVRSGADVISPSSLQPIISEVPKTAQDNGTLQNQGWDRKASTSES